MNERPLVPRSDRPSAPPYDPVMVRAIADPVARKVAVLVLPPIYRSVMERYGLTRVPGSRFVDENGDVA